jgi:hypothetical protein
VILNGGPSVSEARSGQQIGSETPLEAGVLDEFAPRSPDYTARKMGSAGITMAPSPSPTVCVTAKARILSAILPLPGRTMTSSLSAAGSAASRLPISTARTRARVLAF